MMQMLLEYRSWFEKQTSRENLLHKIFWEENIYGFMMIKSNCNPMGASRYLYILCILTTLRISDIQTNRKIKQIKWNIKHEQLVILWVLSIPKPPKSVSYFGSFLMFPLRNKGNNKFFLAHIFGIPSIFLQLSYEMANKFMRLTNWVCK